MEVFSLAEEIRNGYTVTEKQKKIWKVEIDLLTELLRVCKKYDLRIMVYSGTMLGAIRHKGFIPWDDDMDVAMPRKDYEKLLNVASNEFKIPFFFQTALTDSKFFVEYARLRNSNTTGMVTWNKSIDYNNGIYIDIFPLDGYIENKIKLNLQLIKRKFLKQFLSTYYADEDYISKKPAFMVHLLQVVAKKKPYKYWYDKFTKNLCKYNGKTKTITQMTHQRFVVEKYWCTEEDFDNLIWVPFENIEVPVPVKYDEFLKRFYGDYMKFPPVEERGEWHGGVITFDPDTPYKEYITKLESKMKDE